MSEEDSWDWLLNLPRDWERPAELRGPTKSTELNLAIVMLSSERIGNDCIELIGAFLAEVASFNAWIGKDVKGKLGEREFARLYVLQQETIRNVYDAWHSYTTAFESQGGRLPEGEYAQLLLALGSSNADLANLRRNADPTS